MAENIILQQPNMDDIMFDELFGGETDWLLDPNSPNFDMGSPRSPRGLIVTENQPTRAPAEEVIAHITAPPSNPGVDIKETASTTSTTKATKKRKVSNNPSAQLIATATAETLESMNIDPNSKEGKKTKRQIRNRMSAQHHRDKKNQYIQTLEDMMKKKDLEINRLRQEMQMIQSENTFLRDNVSSSCLSLANVKFRSSRDKALDGSTSNTDNEFGSTECSESVPEQLSLPSSSNQSLSSTPPSPMRDFQPAFSGLGTMGRALTIVTLSVCLCFTILGNNSRTLSMMDGDQALSLGMSASLDDGREAHRRLSTSNDIIFTGDLPAVKVASPVENALSVLHTNRRYSSYRDTESIPPPQAREHQSQPYISLPAVDSDSNSSVINSGTKYTSRRYLRRGINHNTSSTQLDAQDNKDPESGEMDLDRSFPLMLGRTPGHSSDVLQKYELPDSNYHQWPPSTSFFDYSVLSYSTVVMTQGKALLDPSLSLSKNNGRAMGSTMRAIPLPPPLHLNMASRDVESRSSDDSSDEDKQMMAMMARIHKSADKEPVIERTPSTSPSSTASESTDRVHTTTSEVAPYANILTIRLPSSSIRLGESWGTSKDGTKENIMNVLNINATASRKTDSESENSGSSDEMSDRSFVENSFVELNCVILGAKLVHNQAG